MIIAACLLAAALLYAIWIFNRLVRLGARADGSWSDIDVQLRRRWDLIPRLAQIARSYADHERRTLEEAVAARTAAAARSDAGPAGRAAAESALGLRGRQLIALAEQYPDLKANTLFEELHAQLVDVEDDLQAARRYYNAVVRDLNTLAGQFPSSLVARLAGRRPREFFEIEDPRDRAAPAVRLEQS
ncbi:MAG: LemA family protein [Phycisphaerales bacterium JB039]